MSLTTDYKKLCASDRYKIALKLIEAAEALVVSPELPWDTTMSHKGNFRRILEEIHDRTPTN